MCARALLSRERVQGLIRGSEGCVISPKPSVAPYKPVKILDMEKNACQVDRVERVGHVRTPVLGKADLMSSTESAHRGEARSGFCSKFDANDPRDQTLLSSSLNGLLRPQTAQLRHMGWELCPATKSPACL